jgi:Tfp pilus assembly protein PilF
MKVGQCLRVDGRAQEAVTLLKQVVKIRDTTLGETHPVRLASQHALATAIVSSATARGQLGQVNEAVTLLEQVVKIKETLAKTDPDLLASRLDSQHELAIAYHANGQVNEAVTLLEQVVKIQETLVETSNPDLLASRLESQHELAIAYHTNGQVNEAVTLLEQVIRETTLEETHPNRLVSQHELARAYHANGQVNEAVTLLEQVVKIQETLVKTYPDLLALWLSSQHELAFAYHVQGQWGQAKTLLEQVIKIERSIFHKGHPGLAVSEEVLDFFKGVDRCYQERCCRELPRLQRYVNFFLWTPALPRP